MVKPHRESEVATALETRTVVDNIRLLRGSTAIGVCRVVEYLAVGFFRGLLALVHAVARLAVDFFWNAVGETAAEVIGRIISTIARAIAFVARILLAPVEWLYRAVFDRVARKVGSPTLTHLFAMALLMSCGFLIGAGASAVYHQAPNIATAAALPER
jgi:hypothetical protein